MGDPIDHNTPITPEQALKAIFREVLATGAVAGLPTGTSARSWPSDRSLPREDSAQPHWLGNRSAGNVSDMNVYCDQCEASGVALILGEETNLELPFQ